MMEQRLRFGIHDFLNSRPVTYAFSKELTEKPFQLTFAPPGELADLLREGQLDMAFIPTVEYARIPGLKIVPDLCIGAVGEVKTVLLVSRKKVWDIEKVAVDKRSRTSVALLRILFREHFRIDARIVSAPSNHAEDMLEKADAGLIIGDEAFKVDREEYNVIDLSQAWLAFTGKPFVFAMVCAREEAPIEQVRAAEAALRQAFEASMQRIDDICTEAGESIGLSREVCRDYLTKHIHYELDGEKAEGLTAFFDLAHKVGVTKKAPELRFVEL